MIEAEYYFRLAGINNQQLFIAFCNNGNIVFSDGSVEKFDQKNWIKSNHNIVQYIKIALKTSKKLINCKKEQFLSDSNRYNKDIDFIQISSSFSLYKNNKKLISHISEEIPISKIEMLENENITLKIKIEELENSNKKLSMQNDELYWEIEHWKRKKNPKDIVIIKNIPPTVVPSSKKKTPIDTNEETRRLELTLKLREAELREQKKINSKLETERDDSLNRLTNLQDWLKINGIIENRHPASSPTISETLAPQKVNLGSMLDGSLGFHEQRENGRFGSLPSFDNYGDEFNER